MGSAGLPAFPPKKLLSLTPNQLEDRRQQLERYIQLCEHTHIHTHARAHTRALTVQLERDIELFAHTHTHTHTHGFILTEIVEHTVVYMSEAPVVML